MQSQEEIFEHPTLERSVTQGPMTIDELNTSSNRFTSAAIPRPELRRQTNQPSFIRMPEEQGEIMGRVPLEREIPSDYGMFDDNIERDVYNWFEKCTNLQRANYIKYLTDRMLLDYNRGFINTSTIPVLHRQEASSHGSCLEPEPMTRERRLGSRVPPPFPHPNLFATPPRGFSSTPLMGRMSPRNVMMTDDYSSDEEFMDVDVDEDPLFVDPDPMEQSQNNMEVE